MTTVPPAPQPPAVAPAKGNGLATGGLVLGIISVATCWIWCFIFISLGCGVIGLILSIIGLKKAKELGGAGAGAAKAGLICSIIGLVISVLVGAIVAVIAALAHQAVVVGGGEFQKQLRDAQEMYNRMGR
jgi:hypothetical protein